MSLKAASPNAIYTLGIAGTQLPGQSGPLTCPQTPILGFLATDADGNGSLHFELDGVVPQHQVWVIADGGGPRLQSPAVDIGNPNS